jgi:spermidine synthase
MRNRSWTKGCESAHCLEVSAEEDVLIRDSKDPEGPVLKFTRREFDEFIEAVKSGTFG